MNDEKIIKIKTPPGKEGGWGKITKGISKFLKGNDLRVYCELIAYTDKNGVCYPSIETLMYNSGMVRSSVQNSIRNLDKNGWLSRTYRPNNSSVYQMYYIHNPNTYVASLKPEKSDMEVNNIPSVRHNDVIMDFGALKIKDGARKNTAGALESRAQRYQYKIPIKDTILLTESEDSDASIEEVYKEDDLNEIHKEGDIIKMYDYLKSGVLMKSNSKSIKHWKMSEKDEELLFQLQEVKPHLITDRLNYGLEKAIKKDTLRFGDILAPAIATISKN